MNLRDDAGSASVLVVAIGLALVAAGVVAAMLAGVRGAHLRVVTAADLAALAGAAAEGDLRDGCAEARRIAQANDVRLATCAVDGAEVRVAVFRRVDLPGRLPVVVFHATARAALTESATQADTG